MEIITIVTMAIVMSFFPIKTGWVAKDLGCNFWIWFLLGLFMPFISMVILLCLPIKKLPTTEKTLPLTYYRDKKQNFHPDIKFQPASAEERLN